MEERAEHIEQAVDLFLMSGQINGVDPAALATRCDERIRQTARQSLTDALELARQFYRRSNNQDHRLRLTATRALARISHMNSHHAEARDAYLSARRLARGDKLSKGRIDRALIDVYMYLGDFPRLRYRARSALRIFEELNSDVDIAMTKVNWANLLHRQDRHKEAERLYAEAARFFETAGNKFAVARCNYNRANTLVQLFDMEAAEALYDQSATIYDELARVVDATDARYGLAWAHMLQGKFHVALRELAECQEAYREAGQYRGVALCELDRAEVYLGLNLLEDAVSAATSAERWFKEHGFRYESSKAAFFEGMAFLNQDSRKQAKRSLERARIGFAEDKNNGFLAAVHLQKARLTKDSHARDKMLRRAQQYYAKAQLPLWQAVCDIELASTAPVRSARLKRLNGNPALQHVPHLYAQWQTIKGDAALAQGRTDEARSYWQAAADRLDAVRIQLPPVEIRSRYGRNISSPHRRLISTEIKDHPEVAAAWIERYKTSGLWSPVNPLLADEQSRSSVLSSLTALAEQVAALSSRISGPSAERSIRAATRDRQVRKLYVDVRQELARLEPEEASRPDSIENLANQIQSLSEEGPIIQFHFSDGDLWALLHAGRRLRVHHWRDGQKYVETILRRWRFHLEKTLLGSEQRTAETVAGEHRLLENVGNWLWEPLEIGSYCRRVLIVPDGELSNLPWSAIRIGNQPLMETHDFVLTPSIRHHLKARSIKTRSQRVEVFLGADEFLPEIRRESELLAGQGGSSVHIHDPARRSDWPGNGSRRVWHFAGHAQLRSDNPFYSFLQMADGPLFAADFRLRQVNVDLVTLAACRSGEQVTVPGEESSGMVRSLLEMGARNIIGSHWPVADKSTALWMTAFYNSYLTGTTISEAYRTASRRVREQYPSAYYWAAFSLFGAGN